ncbi:MAG: GSCFA domain-containing protein [Saprospiraceae bacterium]|nr:GSCFA domain-containing protein [Saprospiraceae bacterium]
MKAIGRQKFTEIFDRNNHENFAFPLDVHSVFNHPEKEMVLQRLEKVIADFHTDLKPVTHCFITLGTSWVYEHLGTIKWLPIVIKMPQQLFKRLLSVDQNTKLLSGTVDQLTAVYPNIKIILR